MTNPEPPASEPAHEVIAPGAFGPEPRTVPLHAGQNGPVIGSATVQPDGPDTLEPRSYSRQEVADKLGVSLRTVDRWFPPGGVSGRRWTTTAVPGRPAEVRILASAVDAITPPVPGC